MKWKLSSAAWKLNQGVTSAKSHLQGQGSLVAWVIQSPTSWYQKWVFERYFSCMKWTLLCSLLPSFDFYSSHWTLGHPLLHPTILLTSISFLLSLLLPFPPLFPLLSAQFSLPLRSHYWHQIESPWKQVHSLQHPGTRFSCRGETGSGGAARLFLNEYELERAFRRRTLRRGRKRGARRPDDLSILISV